jgi:hypothetical protein
MSRWQSCGGILLWALMAISLLIFCFFALYYRVLRCVLQVPVHVEESSRLTCLLLGVDVFAAQGGGPSCAFGAGA